MEKVERIFKLHALLSKARYGVSLDTLMTELGVSRATVYRDIAFLRDSLNAPIEHDTEQHRFSYRGEGQLFDLPGLWLTPDQVYALVLAQEVLGEAGASPFAEIIGSLDTRAKRVLGVAAAELKRMRVMRSNVRQLDPQIFSLITSAVLERKPLRFGYRARSTNQPTERLVHPQRLTHYKDNWYLDAFDDNRRALRSFALDRISRVVVATEEIVDVPQADVDDFAARGYGIFSAPTRDTARIRFSAHAARWVADERWHPQQEGKMLPDGSYELRLPFGHPRELLMDVLRYGSDAEILEPVALRQQMRAMLQLTISNYE